ncbi:MAG TPA: hypothetical protein VFS23_24275 [Vicinamibacterales bacterium]|nr:hypothetical protein [Vicinamibacterales bacterium]
METPTESGSAHRAWSVLFEDRYGVGSVQRLIAMLEQPCVTFARVAEEFGVTRECVRQWHQRLLPGAPSGHRRQQLCREHQMKRQLLQDPLFLGFYRRIRSSVPGQRVTLIRSRAGFRKRTVRIGDRTVLLRRARRGRASSHEQGRAVYTLATGEMGVDFVYYELSSEEYLLVPRELLPARSTTFADTRTSAYQRFRNTLAALELYGEVPSPEDGLPQEAILRSV